jgi:plastocyanin
MDATPACARMHSTPQLSEEVVVNPDGTLKNVFVYVSAGLPAGQKWSVPKESVKVDQNGCVYQPHVVGIMASQDIEFLNSDDTNHNIHPLPRVNREWNESQPPKGDHKIKSFAQAELMMPVKCNVHPWMRLYVNVVAHPFYAVTGDDGSFTIKGLPPGEYTIEALHEKFEKQEIKVKVGPKESGKADFTFKG